MRIAVIGFGTVSKSLLRVLVDKSKMILNDYGVEIKTVGVFKRDGAFINNNGLDLERILSSESYRVEADWVDVADFNKIADELKCECAVELTPTNVETGEPGLSHIKTALQHGMDVVTANKGPLALYYPELMDLANQVKRRILFEATVAGAIPLFNLVRNNLRANRILSVKGILNGTTNYILSRMTSEKLPFKIVLKEAQKLGFAEADPSYDVDGIDAAAKLVILSNALLKQECRFKDVKRQGIRDITPEAIELARKDGFLIKHLATNEDGVLEVAPRLVEIGSSFAVSGSLNVVKLQTDLAKDLTLIGRGAGGVETASSVLNDILELAILRR
ncbi:MAG: homoserine dehydrogenase [Candidatus Odinarchaeum yellowstonii]|uniref:Homoserine dehydrogenase n=1 Tax=Odinarchaeota yellowstonii (strain LCB_4) TaxID=1841599 RepID=A0AAF0IA43_ODILC|nr:MAG: homoserine dehydrogenase [Candidatus Odinarchaeum yellowstonii]